MEMKKSETKKSEARKMWIKVLTISAVGICLTGCGNAIPEMTEQQQELVVEFAASELLKFDQAHATRLISLEMIQEEEENSQENLSALEGQKEPSTDDVQENEGNGESGIPADDVTVIDQTQEAMPESINEFLGLTGISIAYTGYELVDSYPPEAADEVYFFMSATENNKLLVLKFQVENTSSEDKELDFAHGQTRYKIVVNGSEQNALTTMLLNDMAYYEGTLAAEENIELVLVGEVSNEQADQITSLELTMKSVDDTATISLN